MTVIMTIGRESLLLKGNAINAMAEFLQDAKSVSKDYSGRWEVNPKEHLPVIEFTVLPGDMKVVEEPEKNEE